MSNLQFALQEAGLLSIVEAEAKRLGTTVEGAIKVAFTKPENVSAKPLAGTVAFDDAVCAILNPSDNRGYLNWKTSAEKEAGCTLEPMSVYLYAMSGKVSTSLITDEELDAIEEAIDSVSGQ